MVKRRRGRGRRRRNQRTQRPVRITITRTGAGRTTELSTFEWSRPPTGWDVAALGMRVQVQKAQARQKKQARKRYISRAEHRKESRAERWRRKYQTPGDSPFMRLPGMAGGAITHRRQPVISADTRRRAGVASRGAASTLTPETAAHILELRAEGMSYRRIAADVQHPESTIRHWIGSGRAEAAAKDGRRANSN